MHCMRKNNVVSVFQHRRRSQRAGVWTSNSATLNKELSSFLGSSPNARVNRPEVVPDPLLSPFISNASHSEPKGSQKDESLVGHTPLASQSKRYFRFPYLCKFYTVFLYFVQVYARETMDSESRDINHMIVPEYNHFHFVQR